MSRITAEDEDEYEVSEVPRQMIGNVADSGFNGATKIIMWLLGIFGVLVTTLTLAVLEAVYNQNGDLHEVKQAVIDMKDRLTQLEGGTHGRP